MTKVRICILSVLCILSVMTTVATPIRARELAYPIILVPGTFGCWSASAWESMMKIISTNQRNVLSELAAAQTMNTAARAYIGDKANEAIETDATRLFWSRRHIFDYSAMELEHQGDSIWYLEPIENSYNGFFELVCRPMSVGGLGLTPGEDVFVFCYNTITESIEANAKHLSRFVDSILKKTGAEKVQIVAHSQGGIISRQFLQNEGGDAKTSNLILVATPNHGAVTAFDVAKSGEYTTANSDLSQALESILQQDKNAFLGFRFDFTGDADLAMDVLLWMATGMFSKERHVFFGELQSGFAKIGQTSPLYAMLPDFDFIKRKWLSLKLAKHNGKRILSIDRDASGMQTELQKELRPNRYLSQTLNTPEGLHRLANLHSVTTVMAPGIRTVEYLLVAGNTKSMREFVDLETRAVRYDAQYTRAGDGSVLDKSAALYELETAGGSVQYRHIGDLPTIGHSYYFRDTSHLKLWLPNALDMERIRRTGDSLTDGSTATTASQS